MIPLKKKELKLSVAKKYLAQDTIVQSAQRLSALKENLPLRSHLLDLKRFWRKYNFRRIILFQLSYAPWVAGAQSGL